MPISSPQPARDWRPVGWLMPRKRPTVAPRRTRSGEVRAMEARSRSNGTLGPQRDTSPLDEVQRAAIRRELQKILSSPAFRTSKRSQQFLSYVVQHSLEGQTELLKERSIGAELFERPISYATGEDAVVRVLAVDVRKRLAQYYHERSSSSQVRIELPVGSYVPEFRWNSPVPPAEPETPWQSVSGALRRTGIRKTCKWSYRPL